MISEQEYFKFSKKLNKILKKCYVGTLYPDDERPDYKEKFGYPKEELSPSKGSSSLTKNNYYFFRKEALRDCKDDVLSLCALLPKLKTVKEDTAGTIAYMDLLPKTQTNLTTLTIVCEHADKFVALLVLNNIGTRGDFIGTDEFSAVTVDLEKKYKSIVNPDRTGQEPADD